MEKIKLLQAFKNDKIFAVILLLSLISAFRSLIIPLQGDEITYFKIAENILKGKYYLHEYPSTVTPVIPFFIALFHTSFSPVIGIILLKCFNLLFTALGFRFLYLFLKNQNIDVRIILSIIILTAVNTNSIAWFSSLYPEAILFLSFWGFIYYFSLELSVENFKKMFFFLLLLSMTRYLYLILGLTVLFYYYSCLQNKSAYKIEIKQIAFYSFLFLIPVVVWFKYVFSIEQQQLSEISYFNRFQNDNSFLSNIKYGLGLGIHPEVSKVNGIPAFISLFIPITGLRNYLVSIFLILLFLIGYIKTKKSLGINLLFSCTVLVMLGLVFAGTGFSRYWLILLPSFYIGYYFLFNSFNFKDDWFVRISKFISIVYVINELRIDYMIFNKYF